MQAELITECTIFLHVFSLKKVIDMETKRRISPITGKEQVWVQPPELPGIWMHHLRELCERCKTFNKCLEFKSLSDAEWEEVAKLIKETNQINFRECLVSI